MRKITRFSKFGVQLTSIATTVMLSCTLVACTRADKPVSDSEQTMAVSVDGVSLQVINTGSDQKRILKYSTETTSDDQQVSIGISDGFNQTVVAANAVDPTPPAKINKLQSLKLPVSAALRDPIKISDDVPQAPRYTTMTVGDAEFSDTARKDDINSTRGFVLGISGNEYGQQSALTFTAPTSATDRGRALMEQYLLTYASLPIVFPQEEVGVGASWKVSSRVAGEKSLLQTTTFSITDIKGDEVSLAVEVEQHPSQSTLDISIPGDQGDKQLKVIDSHSTSSGKITVDLSRPLPIAGSVSWTSRVVYGGDDSTKRVVQDSTNVISFNGE